MPAMAIELMHFKEAQLWAKATPLKCDAA